MENSYVISIGDLNFRIDDLTGDHIHDVIQNNAQNNSSNFSELFEKDQVFNPPFVEVFLTFLSHFS